MSDIVFDPYKRNLENIKIAGKPAADYEGDIKYPWDLLTLLKKLTSEIQSENQGTIEPGATVKGNVFIGKGTVVKSGAYIEGNWYIGENCVIGPNCYLKEYGSIGDNCVIGNAVEITRSMLLKSVNVRHLCYVGDSVLGNNVNISAGTVLANWRFDAGEVKVVWENQKINSGRTKLGAFIGDNTKTGINCSIMPGIIIAPNSIIFPGTIIKENI
jgi:UDP-N-acetylglucosamine diphosphorylase / glucose-1-phosphate thymidylyltransferase / UDP-N-acetylgalactosamine diphosphorylase / glucosamine-1-phosphate N-acetyltransferase / galactosamine-1-phosphate N-acetyltransferase